jgi:CheY-like chemotaxis protein
VTTILVVDDEPDIRLLLRMTLNLASCEVVEAESGEGALDMLAARDDIDIVLLDVRMPPGLTGWEVLERIGERPTDARPQIVMLSAFDDAKERARAGNAGYLRKPFEQADLLGTIADLRQDQAEREGTRAEGAAGGREA